MFDLGNEIQLKVTQRYQGLTSSWSLLCLGPSFARLPGPSLSKKPAMIGRYWSSDKSVFTGSSNAGIFPKCAKRVGTCPIW